MGYFNQTETVCRNMFKFNLSLPKKSSAFEYKGMFQDHFSYSGKMSVAKKNELFGILKLRLIESEMTAASIKKCLFVFEECTTNIVNYYENKPDADCSINYTKDLTDEVRFVFENSILITDKASVADKMAIIEKIQGKELDLLIQNTLTTQNTNSNKAGLGLLLLKKNYCDKFDFSISNTSNSFETLRLSITIRCF